MKTIKKNAGMIFFMMLIIMLCAFPVNAAEPVIPSDAKVWNGHYYKAYNLQYGWNAAQEYCEAMGGHLAAITSADEQNVVASLAQNAGKNCYWIGTNKTLNYNWVTGEKMSFTNWADAEPDDYQGKQGYVFICGNTMGAFHAGEWSDLSEDGSSWDYESQWGKYNFGFICEWDKGPELSVSLKKTAYTYSGKAITPRITVKYGSKRLKNGKDYKVTYKNNVNAGKATVIVKGTGAYKKEKKKISFEIKAIDFRKVKVSLSNKKYIYDGKSKKPSVKVKYGKRNLRLGTDYTVKYKNNKNTGTAAVIVTGKRNYTGSRTVSFKIQPAFKVSLKKESYTYTGKAIKPVVSVKFGTKILKKGKDYTVKYVNNINSGDSPQVIVTGKGKYKKYGSISKSFIISPLS